MAEKQKIVLATSNPGKLREFKQMLEPLGYEVLSQAEFHVSDAPEPYGTFLENALTKARHVAKETGLPALADDSGLCVKALGGGPGVHSARYAGDNPKSDANNNAKLVKALANEKDRTANYYCVLVYVRSPEDPQPIVADGAWQGEIVLEPKGTNGFGYDPHFYLPMMGKTAAELTQEDKNTSSHRAKALRALMERLS